MRILLLLLLAAAANAESKLSAVLGAETWNDRDIPAHGVAIVAYETDGFPADARLLLELNTDTLRVAYDGVRLSDHAEFGAQLTGEFLIAGLSRDYWRDGHAEPDRGFLSSYARAQTWLKLNIRPRTYFTLEAGARRWFHSDYDDTSSAFELPADAWVFEPRLHWVWWCLTDDPGWRDRHRLFPRVSGVAVGFSAKVDVASESRPWGARDADTFDPPDARNDPAPTAVRGVQWLRAGWQMLPAVRTQLHQSARLASGEDDVTRARIGGLNPYSVNLAGAPWAHNLSDDYAAAAWSWHLRVWDDLELGPLADAVILRDIGRTGDTAADLMWGVGGLVDWRSGPWQIDARGGWSPTLADRSGKAAWNAWLSVGWATPL